MIERFTLACLKQLGARARPALAALAAAPLLSGCQLALLDPQGPVGAAEKALILQATYLMLLVVVPVIFLTLLFAWHFRASNTRATFKPDWDHSGKIEFVVWLVPCLIIITLATITWISTHKLDPRRPLEAQGKPLEVEVVSLDWKWLFIYPELKIASVNELAVPVSTTVHFRLTSSSVMNSFFIPQLGSQIYTMPGMETGLNLLADKAGSYEGISANFSGDGFSDMKFVARAMSQDEFDAWVAKVRTSKDVLTSAAYRQLAQPSERAPVSYYGDVAPALFHDILNKCSEGAMCMGDATKLSMMKDTTGGHMVLCDAASPKGL